MQDPYHAQDPGASILSVSFVEKGFNPYCDTNGTPKPPRRLVPLQGFAVQTPLRDLSASEFLNFFPADEDGGVQHLKSHEQHPCSRAAAAATVHELTVALLAAAFMTLFKVYRQLGYYQFYIWQTTSGWPPMIGANQVAAWNSMTNTERAAMLLFMNPPTRGPADNDMETCLRVRPQGHCRGVARRLSPYPVLMLQQAGTYKAIGRQHYITVKSVRATLPCLLCHLFIGPNRVKMYKALQAEHRQIGSSSQEGAAVGAEYDNDDPDQDVSVRAAAKQAFEAALQEKLGSTEEPTGMWMVCHRDKPDFAEYQPVATKEYMTVGTKQPRQPRCLCYSCINLVHLFQSTVGQNTRTGATKVQQVSRKRRRGFPNYDG